MTDTLISSEDIDPRRERVKTDHAISDHKFSEGDFVNFERINCAELKRVRGDVNHLQVDKAKRSVLSSQELSHSGNYFTSEDEMPMSEDSFRPPYLT